MYEQTIIEDHLKEREDYYVWRYSDDGDMGLVKGYDPDAGALDVLYRPIEP